MVAFKKKQRLRQYGREQRRTAAGLARRWQKEWRHASGRRSRRPLSADEQQTILRFHELGRQSAQHFATEWFHICLNSQCPIESAQRWSRMKSFLYLSRKNDGKQQSSRLYHSQSNPRHRAHVCRHCRCASHTHTYGHVFCVPNRLLGIVTYNAKYEH